MSIRYALLIAVIITSALCVLFATRIPRLLPLVDARVRSDSMQALRQLRMRGYWAINTDIKTIKPDDKGVCIEWIYRYRGRKGPHPVEYLETCSYD